MKFSLSNSIILFNYQMMPLSRWATFLAAVFAPTISVMQWWTSTCKFTSLHFFSKESKILRQQNMLGDIQMARIPILWSLHLYRCKWKKMYGSKLLSYCFSMFDHNLPNYYSPYFILSQNNGKQVSKIESGKI